MPPTQRKRPANKQSNRLSAVNSSKNLTALSSSSASTATIMSPSMPLFPSSLRCRLRYSENFAIQGSVGTIANYIFRGNDLYDTNVTSTGHQPMGFDQMMVFFDHFIVERATMRARFTNLNSSSSVIYCRVDGNNANISDPNVLLETGGVVSDVLSSNGNQGSSKILTCSLDVAKFHGVNTSALTSMDSLQGAIASSPTDGIYFHVGTYDPNGSTAWARVVVVIDFDAIFTEPRVPSLSRISTVHSACERRRLMKVLDGEKKFSPETI